MARVRIEENGAVRTVTLTRSDKRNALDNQMLDELEAAFIAWNKAQLRKAPFHTAPSTKTNHFYPSAVVYFQ